MLRAALALHLGCVPAELLIERGPWGKPALRGEGTGVGFSLSHCAGLGAVVLSVGREVGVDVEPVSRALAVDALTEAFFQKEDAEWVLAQPAAAQRKAALRLFVSLEALVKTRGGALTVPALSRAELASGLELWCGELASGHLLAVGATGGPFRLRALSAAAFLRGEERPLPLSHLALPGTG